MKATITKTIIAVLAGLAILADAFLLFIKPHLNQQAGAAISSNANNPTAPDISTPSDSGSASSGTDSDENAQSGSDSSSDSSSTGSTGSTGSTYSDTESANQLTDGTYTSVATPNKYGEIQLQVTVSGGKITTISTVKAPTHGRSQSINAQAIPELTDRAISAQSSEIQFVTGATETSTAFVNSLQDAINQSLNAKK